MMNSKIIDPPGIPAIFAMSIAEDVDEVSTASTEIKH